MSSDVEEMASIEELLKEADFVTFHVPLIDATMNLLNKDRMTGMKDGAVILNFARNGVIDDDAALAAIESGKDQGRPVDDHTGYDREDINSSW